jgi:predicted PurR-regulated permease PerM
VIVQQILENLVAPRILGSVTGLNPVWIFISILIGAKVGGLLGVVIAVPTAVVVKTALETVRSRIVVAAPEVEVLPASAANEPSTEDLSEVPQV